MLIFKHKHDLQQLERNTPVNKVLRQCFNRNGHLEGYFVLIEEGDTYIDLPELKADLRDLSFDGVFKTGGFYHAVYLTSNEFALEFIIPDANWLSAELKRSLETHI